MLLLSSGLNGSPKERGHVSPSPQSRAREYDPFRGLGFRNSLSRKRKLAGEEQATQAVSSSTSNYVL